MNTKNYVLSEVIVSMTVMFRIMSLEKKSMLNAGKDISLKINPYNLP